MYALFAVQNKRFISNKKESYDCIAPPFCLITFLVRSLTTYTQNGVADNSSQEGSD